MQSLWIVNILNDCFANLLHSYLFWASCELRVASYGLETVSKSLRILMRKLLGFHAIIVWAWHVQSGHTLTTERVQYRLFVYCFLHICRTRSGGSGYGWTTFSAELVVDWMPRVTLTCITFDFIICRQNKSTDKSIGALYTCSHPWSSNFPK